MPNIPWFATGSSGDPSREFIREEHAMDDIRNHSTAPTAEEREWMEARLVRTMVYVGIQTVVAVVIGISVSQVLEPAPQSTVAAASVPATPAR
jgi:hypothetical protein